MENKICRCCYIEQPIINFCISRKNYDGYNHFCKSCCSKKSKEYLEKNKDKVKEKNKKFNARIDVKERRSKYSKEYREANLDIMRKKALEKQATNRKNPIYKLKESIRNSIRNSFKKCGIVKNTNISNILGCSFDEFKQYLESKFEPWMNWENRGFYNGEFNYGWDIDHIIPIKFAKTEEDIIRLNHYTNLQPLCSHYNRDIKRDNI